MLCGPKEETAVAVEAADVNSIAPVVSELLTPRMNLIAFLVAKSLTNKQIAVQLGTGEQMIKNYMLEIFKRLSLANRMELATFVLKQPALTVFKV